MATNTTNYNLKKPALTDFYDVADQNGNMDLIDAAMKGLEDGKVAKVTGKVLSTNDFTTDEKTKLQNIAANAQVNVIETVKVNGVALTPTTKAVDVTVPAATVVNNTLTSTSTTAALSAAQGKVLKDSQDDLKGFIGYVDSDIYGVEVDFVNKVFTRLAGAVGKTPGANFNSVNAFGARKRCIVTNAGIVLAYYGDGGYTETGKLTIAITKDSTTYPVGTVVQVMVEQPKFYYKVVPLKLDPINGGKGFHMRKARYYISDTMKSGFKIHPAFIVNGVEKNFMYFAAYEGCAWDTSASNYIMNDTFTVDFANDMLSSISGAKPMSGYNQALTRGNTRLLSQKRGAGWQQSYGQTVSATQMLFLIEYASLNMQTAIGLGVTSKTDDGATNMSNNTGATSSLGNGTGMATGTDGLVSITYRGEENLYGNIWTWTDGLNINAKSIHEVYVTDNTFADDTITGVYKNAGITLAKANGYISAFGYNEPFDWLFMPSEVLGDSAVPVGDYFYQNYTYNAIMVAVLGSYWDNGVYAGGFFWNVYNVSGHYARTVGGRLVYVPQ